VVSDIVNELVEYHGSLEDTLFLVAEQMANGADLVIYVPDEISKTFVLVLGDNCLAKANVPFNVFCLFISNYFVKHFGRKSIIHAEHARKPPYSVVLNTIDSSIISLLQYVSVEVSFEEPMSPTELYNSIKQIFPLA
jgi:hypothetical protein